MVALVVVLTFGAYLNAFGIVSGLPYSKNGRWLNTPARTPGLLLILVSASSSCRCPLDGDRFLQPLAGPPGR
jgi:hypothetical protein